MDRLKVEYPNIPKESYDYRKSNLNIWAINLGIKFLFPLYYWLQGYLKGLEYLLMEMEEIYFNRIYIHGYIFSYRAIGFIAYKFL